MPRGPMLVLGAVAAFAAAFLAARGQQGETAKALKPGKLSKEEQAALKPGLTLRFYPDANAKEPLDARRVRLAALHVPAGSPPTPLLSPRPFTARLTGYLKVPLRGEYSFSLVGSGACALLVNGKEVVRLEDGTTASPSSPPVEMPKGYSRVELVCTSPAKGDATARAYWSGEGFAKEPLPPEALFSRGDDADLVRGATWREGRYLYATLGCARCHALPGKLAAADCAMPEMRQQAPSLEGAGKRLGTAWVARWVLDPRALRPQATMPKVLHGADAEQQAADLAAFLATLTRDAAPVDTAVDLEKGGKLFEQLGCVACHHLDAPKKDDPHGRLSLALVGARFEPGALYAYLRDPHAFHPWTRMPDFKLTPQEAGFLTGFLLDRAHGGLDGPAKKGDATRGGKLFGEAGCASCHAVKAGEKPAAPSLPAPAAGAPGCLAGDGPGRGKAPDFGLSDAQRQALRAFLQSDGSSLARETPAEFAARQVEVLQCAACHRRDGGISRLVSLLEDDGTGKLPELPPALTWAGEKLRPEWTARLLAGTHDHRARPWLRSRMPAFPARAEVLAAGLSHEHGFAAGEDPRPATDPKLAEVGRKLMPMQGGFNCVMCHAVGSQPAVAPFEAPGINLLDAALRLRHEYYQRWMLDPPRVDLATRMPRFAPDGKTTPLTEVLGGDARRQFDAVWHHLQTLPEKNGK